MIPLDTPVVREHVESQLQRMLADPRFAAAPNQSRFLALVVKRALDGKKTREEFIGRKLFPGFIKDESPDVRVTAGNLRRTIQKYYANEGFGDLIRIALPEPPKDKSVKLPAGEAYTPRFSYNPNHIASQNYRLGEYFLHRANTVPVSRAAGHFQKVLEIVPDHVGAIIGLAEAYICEGDVHANAEEKTSFLSVAERCLAVAQVAAPGYWRAHAAQAFLFQVKNELESAERKYCDALALDYMKTDFYPFYQQFLGITGRKLDLLEAAERFLYHHIDDVSAHEAYATALTGIGKFDEAVEILKTAIDMESGNQSLRMTLALIYAHQKRPEDASEQLKCLEPILDAATFAFVSDAVAHKLAEERVIS